MTLSNCGDLECFKQKHWKAFLESGIFIFQSVVRAKEVRDVLSSHHEWSLSDTGKYSSECFT